MWPAKRCRWWCLLVPDVVPLEEVLPWPSSASFKKVREVLPAPSVTQHEYCSLELSDYELQQFEKRRPITKYLLDLDRPLPTALHSWGNQVLSCPCGCRNAPFRQKRLDRGICAVLVRGPSTTITGAPNFRHLSAREVGLLCGLSPLTDCGAEPRLALALVGQLASPLQAAWVASHLARALRSIGHQGLNCPEPLALLDCQKLELLAQAELAGLRKPLLERGSWIVPDSPENDDIKEGDLQPQLKRQKSATRDGLATPEIACTESDTGSSIQGEPEQSLPLWSSVTSPKRCFLSHLLQQVPEICVSPLVQVRGINGELLPRDHLLAAGEVVEIWVAATSACGVGASSQSTALPANVASFIKPSISHASRIAGLEMQGPWVTDDLMRFGLDFVASTSGRTVQVVDPLVLHRCLPSEFVSMVHAVAPGDEVNSAIVCQGHWITLHWKVGLGRVTSWISAPPGTLLEEIGVADWLFAKVAGTRNFLYASGVSRPLAPGLCGHFALADLRSRIQGSLPQEANPALATSAIITASFRLSLPQLCRAPLLIGGTLTQLLEQSLVTLLRSKGACEGDVPARAAALITKLGADPVQCALSSSAPWKQLKALASLTSPPLQLILPSELQRQIASRGQDASAGNRQSKKKQPKPKMPDHDLKAKFQALQPAQVQILTGVFVNGTTGILLGRLQVSEISPQAEGVVLASPAEALPYLTLTGQSQARHWPCLFLVNFRPRRLLPNAHRSGFRQHVQSRESLCFLQPRSSKLAKTRSSKRPRPRLRHLKFRILW